MIDDGILVVRINMLSEELMIGVVDILTELILEFGFVMFPDIMFVGRVDILSGAILGVSVDIAADILSKTNGDHRDTYSGDYFGVCGGNSIRGRRAD